MEVFIFPDIFSGVPAKMYVAVIVLPILGIFLGFVAASVFRLDQVIRRTIAIECGIQNVGTALAIVSLSYPYHVSCCEPFVTQSRKWVRGKRRTCHTLLIVMIDDSCHHSCLLSSLQQLRQVWLFPFLYAFSMLGVCVFFATAYQVQKWILSKKSFDLEENFSRDIHRKILFPLCLDLIFISSNRQSCYGGNDEILHVTKISYSSSSIVNIFHVFQVYQQHSSSHHFGSNRFWYIDHRGRCSRCEVVLIDKRVWMV